VAETIDQRGVLGITAIGITCQIANISLCFWRLSSSTTQMKVFMIFLAFVSFVAISFRVAVVKQHAEFVSIINNLFDIDAKLGIT